MITRGLLWYDDDAERDLADKIARAVERYRLKFGAPPDTCYVHPSALENNGKRLSVDGVRVAPLRGVLPHHFWLGQEEKRPASPSVKTHRRGNSSRPNAEYLSP